MANGKRVYKVQAVATMLGTTVDSVRQLLVESGIDVQRQEHGPRTLQFTLANVFELAAWRRSHGKENLKVLKRGLVTCYAPKGGVGKTTVAANMACIFGLMGFKTLIVDLDFQANLTLAFGYDSDYTMSDAKERGIPIEEIVVHHFGNLTPGWPGGRATLDSVIKKPYGDFGPHLIPSDLTLDRLDTILTYDALEGKKSDMKIAALIQEGLTGKNKDFDLTGYDIILFDAAPAKSRMTKGALLASDFVVSPVSLDKFSTKGVSYLSSVLTDMREDVGRSPELMLLSNFMTSNRARVDEQVAVLCHQYPEAMLNKGIRRSEDFPKTLSAKEKLPPLVLAKPSSDACIDLRDVAAEILARMGVI